MAPFVTPSRFFLTDAFVSAPDYRTSCGTPDFTSRIVRESKLFLLSRTFVTGWRLKSDRLTKKKARLYFYSNYRKSATFLLCFTTGEHVSRVRMYMYSNVSLHNPSPVKTYISNRMERSHRYFLLRIDERISRTSRNVSEFIDEEQITYDRKRYTYSKHPEENVCSEVTILTFTDTFKALRKYNFTNACEIVTGHF